MKLTKFALVCTAAIVVATFASCDNGGESTPPVAKTVAVAAQSGTLMAWTTGTATFAVTTTGIDDGKPGSAAWYTTAAGTTVGTKPQGVDVPSFSVTGGRATVTVNAMAADAGTYYFKVTVDGTVSTGTATLTVSPAPEGEKSEFWSDAYRQYQFNGRVKTVVRKTTTRYNPVPNNYNLMEFDDKGNLIKDHSKRLNDPAYYSGLTLSYDTQNRITKVVYGNSSTPEREVAEFGYDGSHGAYIPTNIYSMEDLRLQKGVTSVKYTIEGKNPLEVTCASVNGNRITFEGTVGGLASMLGNVSTVEVECSDKYYPSHITFKNMGTTHSEANITFGDDGMPAKVVYTLDDGETVTTEYISKGGFLLMTKQYKSSNTGDYTEHFYDGNGHLSYILDDGDRENYTYEYDGRDNWTTRRSDDSDLNEVVTREYTYWE